LDDVFNPRALIPSFAEKAQRRLYNLLTKPRFLALAKAREFSPSLPSRLRMNRFLIYGEPLLGTTVWRSRRMTLGALGTRQVSIPSAMFEFTRHAGHAS
jgi:hypothetical protein